ncbi:MAG: radical SAM protein [Firmicutes bacterium]|nr:radical SAM protein [Bacillota bacterium]
MKESVFNIKFSVDNEDYIYNTRTGGLISLKADDLNNQEIIDYLFANKFFVDDDFDEVEDVINEVNINLTKEVNDLQITLLLTEACNFRCVYCYQEHNPQKLNYKNADMIILQIEKILTKKSYSELGIHYFGGEPLLNSDVLIYVDKRIDKLCRNLNVSYKKYITTNGSLITNQIIETVNFDDIQITIEGLKNTHEMLRVSSEFSFDNIISNIDNILPTCKHLTIRINLCKENSKEVIPLIDFLMDKFCKYKEKISINFSKMEDYGNGRHFHMLTYEEYSQLRLTSSIHLANKYGIELKLHRLSIYNCAFLYNKAFAIKPDMSVLYCSGSNLSTEMFSADLVDIIKPFHLNDECKICKIMPICLGGCAMRRKLGSVSCVPEKLNITDILRYYVLSKK